MVSRGYAVSCYVIIFCFTADTVLLKPTRKTVVMTTSLDPGSTIDAVNDIGDAAITDKPENVTTNDSDIMFKSRSENDMDIFQNGGVIGKSAVNKSIQADITNKTSSEKHHINVEIENNDGEPEIGIRERVNDTDASSEARLGEESVTLTHSEELSRLDEAIVSQKLSNGRSSVKRIGAFSREHTDNEAKTLNNEIVVRAVNNPAAEQSKVIKVGNSVPGADAGAKHITAVIYTNAAKVNDHEPVMGTVERSKRSGSDLSVHNSTSVTYTNTVHEPVTASDLRLNRVVYDSLATDNSVLSTCPWNYTFVTTNAASTGVVSEVRCLTEKPLGCQEPCSNRCQLVYHPMNGVTRGVACVEVEPCQHDTVTPAGDTGGAFVG